MKPLWWSCVFGLLCMPANVMLTEEIIASQSPSSISSIRINSSAEITCSTSLTKPMGLDLLRYFRTGPVTYLNFENGQVSPNIADKFKGRFHINPDLQTTPGDYRVTMHLSLLGLEDTDLYYCSWVYYDLKTFSSIRLSTNGTLLIITERGPEETCTDTLDMDITFLFLGIALAVILFIIIIIALLILRCRRFKKNFRLIRAAKPPPRPIRPQHDCHHHLHQVQHYPYLVTTVNPSDFRGIL